MTVTTTTRKLTFNAFLHTETGQRVCPPDAYPRLLAADINSLAALERWTRERYPREYKTYSLFRNGTGRDLVQRMWAEYLKWSEE